MEFRSVLHDDSSTVTTVSAKAWFRGYRICINGGHLDKRVIETLLGLVSGPVDRV